MTDPTSILLVDDHPRTLVALAAVLAKVDCRVDKARSGRDALKRVLAQDFAVIVLDVHMPGMDGFETAALIRARERSRYTPIIFMTAFDEPRTKALEGYQLGAVDYIYTPVNPYILFSKVSFFVDLFRKTVALEQRAADLNSAGLVLTLASKHKSDVMANMSHELRTPLNAIIGFSQVMLDRDINEVSHETRQTFLTHVRDSGQHLLKLIDTILDIAKVEAGHMVLQLAPVVLGELIDNCVAVVQSIASQKNIRLLATCDCPGVPVKLDAVRVKQIVYNLLSNAVKFTPKGGLVTITSRLSEQQARIEVRDTGPGIELEDQARIFEEFQQVVVGPGRLTEGTGLGLALVRTLVELHGGTVDLESVPGQGSCFTVTFPFDGLVELNGRVISESDLRAVEQKP